MISSTSQRSFDELHAAAPDSSKTEPAPLSIPLHGNSEPVMSSLEIAAITGKPHRNVTGDIARILEEAEIDAQGFLHIYTDSQNREQKCYVLPRRECDLVISGYSVKYRLAIIDRWRELEAEKAAAPALPNYPEALRQLACQIEANDGLKLEIAKQAPKVAAFNRLEDADGTMCVTNSAKALQVQPKRLMRFLIENQWLYRRAGSGVLTAYQNRIQAGMLVHKITHRETDDDGNEKIYEQARVTARGLAKLAVMLDTTIQPPSV